MADGHRGHRAEPHSGRLRALGPIAAAPPGALSYPPPGLIGPYAIAWWGLRTRTKSVRVEGLEHVPASGPVMLVARHMHHLLDGSVILRNVRRPVHIAVGLDWTDVAQRRWMERACRAADYPIVLRERTLGARAGYSRADLLRTTRRALADTTRLLRAGRVVLVFPEGYPDIDPDAAAPRPPGQLPFAGGYARMIDFAERDGVTKVALVPVGFSYAPAEPADARRPLRWNIQARFGPVLADRSPEVVESTVRRLCSNDAP